MFRVVTVSKEYATGGVIGRRLAERLGWQLLDRQSQGGIQNLF